MSFAVIILGTILLAGVSSALVMFVAAFRKRRFFRSKEYCDNLEALQAFSRGVKENLSSQEIIGNDAIAVIVANAVAPLSFFRKISYRLNEEVSEIVASCETAEERLCRHDIEVRILRDFATPVSLMLSENVYIPNSAWQDISERGKELVGGLSSGPFVLPGSEEASSCVMSVAELVAKHNCEFVERECARLSGFFESLAKYPLDEQQKRCCLVDDDAVLVVAGAGSGKTSVIMAKVAYLVNVRGVSPEKILLISFTNKAAQEMSERIAGCLGGQLVCASTFHKFGIGIIKRFAQQSCYDIADDAFLKRTIHSAMTGAGDFAPELYDSAVDFVAYHLDADVGYGEEYATFADKIEHDKRLDLRTLKSIITNDGENVTLGGQTVKSAEEVLIANFLFLNGIEYEYEKRYDKPYQSDRQHRAYHPDFYLPEYQIYLEHYGIDEHGNPPKFFSPVERDKYKASIEWKRHLHSEAKNKYIESYSWWCSKDVLFENLKHELSRHGVVLKPRPKDEVFRLLQEKAENRLSEIETLLATFITLFKSNGYDISEFDKLLQTGAGTMGARFRRKSFLRLARGLFECYTRELERNGLFDFSDMINKSAKIVEGLPRNTLGYTHVIVDEYQDVSMSRMRLIKSVIDNTGAHLLCVGDDWQSIYRFAGSDISLFTNFRSYFEHAVELKIENTYRNSQELIDIASRFVMMNPRQISKTLRSRKHVVAPVELLYYDSDKEKVSALNSASRRIYKDVAGKEASVILLGRTKYDVKVVCESKIFVSDGSVGRYRIPQAPNLKFEFLTVHKSKGLEGDYVILLNAEAGNLGFPNRIADDPVLQLMQGEAETYEFAEERRLFYVALTRTRNKIYILVPCHAYSVFIDDIYKIGVENRNPKQCDDESEVVLCPKCGKGHLVRRSGRHGAFSGCSNYPQCDYTVNFLVSPNSPKCPACGGFLAKRYMKTTKVPFWGCTNYPYCGYTVQCR